MLLTIQILRSNQACLEQRNTFWDLFGYGVNVTPEVCAEHAEEFDWGWAAHRFLPWPVYDEVFAPAKYASLDVLRKFRERNGISLLQACFWEGHPEESLPSELSQLRELYLGAVKVHRQDLASAFCLAYNAKWGFIPRAESYLTSLFS